MSLKCRKNYKDITFDNLKQRHDNFFFEKAIKTKNEYFDTMHFKGIFKNPNTPKIILFQKQHVPVPKRDFSNEKFLNLATNFTFFQDF